jgi:hydrogenase maturation factor
MNGYFKPAKRLLVRDNFYGIMMLKINDYLSSQRQIANSHIRLMKSSKDKKTADQINEMLWNMLTGNVPYREIFFKAMNPGFVSKILPIDMLAWIRQKRDDISECLRRN